MPLVLVLAAARRVLWRQSPLIDGSRSARSSGLWTPNRSIELGDVVTGAQLRPFRTSPGRAGAPSEIALFVSTGGRSDRLARWLRRRLTTVHRDQLDAYEARRGALRVFVPVRDLRPERAAVGLDHLVRHLPEHLRETAGTWN